MHWLAGFPSGFNYARRTELKSASTFTAFVTERQQFGEE
jgi:hypothetical protein